MERYSIFDCQMKCFNDAWSSRKLQAILAVIEKYIVDHKIKHIAIKLPAFSVPAPSLTELLEKIKNLAQIKNIPLHIYSIAQIKRAWTGTHKINKKGLMKCILKKHPELQIEYDREMKNKVTYYDKLFEAVGAAGIVCNK